MSISNYPNEQTNQQMTQDDIPGAFDPASDLDANEIRVLAVLAEKEALTPDNYPMSLNAIMNGCNQLSSRDPVMQLSEDVVHDTLQRLMQRKLAGSMSQAGARVIKYEHRMRIKWSLEQDKVAVLTVLMLRGLQTAGEIRARSGRLHEFKSVAEAGRARCSSWSINTRRWSRAWNARRAPRSRATASCWAARSMWRAPMPAPRLRAAAGRAGGARRS
jgi:hypothetical protein